MKYADYPLYLTGNIADFTAVHRKPRKKYRPGNSYVSGGRLARAIVFILWGFTIPYPCVYHSLSRVYILDIWHTIPMPGYNTPDHGCTFSYPVYSTPDPSYPIPYLMYTILDLLRCQCAPALI